MVHKHRVRIAASDDGAPVYKWITAHSVDALNDRIVQTYIESGRIGEFMKMPKRALCWRKQSQSERQRPSLPTWRSG